MRIDTLLSTIILVSFLVTIVMAVGSYAAYKLREARRPRADPPPPAEASPYFDRVVVDDS
jgi:heme/copper-type cytochrome/quinol oxidase subunit 2